MWAAVGRLSQRKDWCFARRRVKASTFFPIRLAEGLRGERLVDCTTHYLGVTQLGFCTCIKNRIWFYPPFISVIIFPRGRRDLH